LVILTLRCLTQVPEPGSNPTQNAAVVPVTGGNPSVTANDQEYDGNTVIVADAISQGPGWMVIHNQLNGTWVRRLVETPVINGDNKNIAVKMILPSHAVLYAMLHVDAGTVGKYEFPGPDVPVMLNGQMLSPAFNATIKSSTANIPPSITVSNQDVSGGKVT